MNDIWTALKRFLEKNLLKTLSEFFATVGKVIDFLRERRIDEKKSEAGKEVKAAEKKIDKACDSGGLDDLFDAASELANAKRKQKEIGR